MGQNNAGFIRFNSAVILIKFPFIFVGQKAALGIAIVGLSVSVFVGQQNLKKCTKIKQELLVSMGIR